jgi:hypothetical protein
MTQIQDVTRNPIWTAQLREAARQISISHRNRDIRSRAQEIWAGARVGSILTDLNIEFITAMRSRFDPYGDSASCATETAFNLAWSDAWDAAKGGA